ncbi:MAG TPA: hypothetical protein VEX35_10335 [Allosphingosinicella sp.]|nr:hypothetical protein [Allosphingosinicella sp.]
MTGARSPLRRMTVAGISGLIVAGCQSSPPPYAAPTNREALIAMADSARVDAGQPVPAAPTTAITRTTIDAPGTMARNTGNVMLQAQDIESRRTGLQNAQMRRVVHLGACEWQAVDPGKVLRRSRERIEGRIDHAYHCPYRQFFATPSRGPVRSDGAGYFYREGDRFLHADIRDLPSNSERIDALPAE